MLTLAIALGLALETTTPPLSRQEIYNAAQAAFDRGDDQAAADGFARVLNSEGKDSRTDGLIRARYAEVLRKLARLSEALGQAERAARELAVGAQARDADLAAIYTLQGDLLRSDLDMEEAIVAYDKARAALPVGMSAFTIDLGTIFAAMVTHPDRAAAVADALLADKDMLKAMDDANRSYLLSLRARAELNRDAPERAADFARSAVAASGELTRKVSLPQVYVRSDAALIFSKMRNTDVARRFLAYSGAGFMPSMNWLGSAELDLPVCGGEMQPQDVAVVEFSIAPDGRVNSVQPIYASRPGPTGVAFARAIREWQFVPSAVAELNNFWRSAIRLELRCVSRPAPQKIGQPFVDATKEWFARQSVTFSPDGDFDAQAATALQRANLVRLGDLLGQAFGNSGWKGTQADPVPIDNALVAAHAPPGVRAAFARSIAYRTKVGSLTGRAAERAALLQQMITRIEPQAESAYAVAWLRVEQAIELETAGQFDAARPILDKVLETPAAQLGDRDPVRLVATLHRSLIEKQSGDAGAARPLTQAGLDAQQCSLFDVHPVATNASISSSTFPGEALRWGMEGIAREAFDIAPTGRSPACAPCWLIRPSSSATRPSAPYRVFRYIPPTLDGTALGCTGQLLKVHYQIPR